MLQTSAVKASTRELALVRTWGLDLGLGLRDLGFRV